MKDVQIGMGLGVCKHIPQRRYKFHFFCYKNHWKNWPSKKKDFSKKITLKSWIFALKERKIVDNKRKPWQKSWSSIINTEIRRNFFIPFNKICSEQNFFFNAIFYVLTLEVFEQLSRPLKVPILLHPLQKLGFIYYLAN